MRNCDELRLNKDQLSTVNQKDVAGLRKKYDVSLENARDIIGLLGYSNALKYTNWFFSSSLDSKCYLPGAKKVAEGFVKISELNVSIIETIVNDSIRTFGITPRQLNQKEYLKVSELTGTIVSGDNPYNSSHGIEHEFSRIDRLEN